jgi:outer membrane protein, multidrug efflux system
VNDRRPARDGTRRPALRTRRLAASLLCAGLAVALAGCVGPSYQRPDDMVPVEQYRSVLEQQTAESFADVGWADIFHDPELAEWIRTAIESNLDLKIAAARVEEFRAQHRIARSALGPQIVGQVQSSPSQQGDEDSLYSAGLSLRWEIDLFGRLRRGNEAARAQLLGTEDAARGVMNSLVASVATTWFQLRELDDEVQIITDTIKSQDESLALVRSLNRSGVASGTEEQQALGQLATTRAQLPTAQQRREQTENTLRFLLGDPPDKIPRIQSSRNFDVPDQIPVGLPSQLLARRPDVRQAENQLHAATAQIGVAMGSRFPYLSIGVTSFFGLVSPELSRLFDGKDPAQELFSVGPFAEMPIFQSGAGQGNVDAARARARQAELTYRSTVLQALREVSNALVSTDKVREVIQQNGIRTEASREVLRLQRMRYRAGVVSYLEVLDAERQLFSAEIDDARSKLDQLLAYVELYRALGGGWSEEELKRLLEQQ